MRNIKSHEEMSHIIEQFQEQYEVQFGEKIPKTEVHKKLKEMVDKRKEQFFEDRFKDETNPSLINGFTKPKKTSSLNETQGS